MKPRLTELRQALLSLHKTLVESERVNYERAGGTVGTPHHFLQLLTSDPWFAWLHPLSELIVAIDEALDEKVPLTEETVNSFFAKARLLLAPSESGQGFPMHYFDAMQRDPDVVLAHAETTKVLGLRKRKV